MLSVWTNPSSPALRKRAARREHGSNCSCRHLAPQFPEKLPHIRDHQFAAVPKKQNDLHGVFWCSARDYNLGRMLWGGWGGSSPGVSFGREASPVGTVTLPRTFRISSAFPRYIHIEVPIVFVTK